VQNILQISKATRPVNYQKAANGAANRVLSYLNKPLRWFGSLPLSFSRIFAEMKANFGLHIEHEA